MNDIPRLSATPAVVVGACGHGLGIVRALGRAGVPVFVLESNRALPGAKTRLAQVQLVADINGLGLIDALLEFRRSLECPGPPVLFLTNDTMVRTVGTHWERLAGTYLLSWSESRGPLLPLLEKSSLAARCSAQGLAYPKTYLLRCDADIDEAIAHVGFPIIVKPARPLAGFKTALPGSRQELQSLVETCAADLPFLVQTFIAGDDTAIFFSALYLDRGRVLARFDGHKLRSKPLGHTTIAESCPDDEVFAQASKFFDGLDISGPVSLELKRDPNGTLWVIEPTVGRTDFWLGLCMENGVDLPLVEYQHQIQRPLPALAQTDRAVWFNEERDPFGLVWFAAQPTLGLRGRRAVFLYLGAADFLPVATSLQNTTLNLFRSAWRVSMRNACSVPRLIRDGCRSVSAFVVSPLRRVDRASTAAVSVSGFPAQAHTVEIFRHPNQFPQDVRDLFNHAERSSVQLGCSWYENLIGTIFPDHGGVFIYVLRRQGDAIAALPILAAASAGTHRIDALANYYTSIYAPALAPQVCAQE